MTSLGHSESFAKLLRGHQSLKLTSRLFKCHVTVPPHGGWHQIVKTCDSETRSLPESEIMPPKFEAEDIVFQRDVEKAQLLAGLADHRRARHACVVCDRFLGDAPETAVTLNASTGNPYLFCVECICWMPKNPNGWGKRSRSRLSSISSRV